MPDPVATRHDSWIRTAVWVRTRVTALRSWLLKEAADYKSHATTEALQWIRTNAAEIHLQALLYTNHLVKIYHALEAQSMPTPGEADTKPVPVVLTAYPRLMGLLAALTTSSTASTFTSPVEQTLLGKKGDGTPYYVVPECRTQFQAALKAMVQKLGTYLDSHAAFIAQVQALHPKNVASIATDVTGYRELFQPGELAQLQSPNNGEWCLYRAMCRTVPCEAFDLFTWWSARREELPILARAALAALATPAHSMDIERVFSRLGGLLSPQRMGLSAENKWSHLSFAVHGDVLQRLR